MRCASIRGIPVHGMHHTCGRVLRLHDLKAGANKRSPTPPMHTSTYPTTAI